MKKIIMIEVSAMNYQNLFGICYFNLKRLAEENNFIVWYLNTIFIDLNKK